MTKTSGGVTDTYRYDSHDRLLSAGGKSYTYDANGNVKTVSVGGTQTASYTWDYEDRLVSIGGTSATNLYNGLDLRIARTSAGGGPSFNYYCDGAEPASPVLYDGFDTYTQGRSPS